MAPHLEKELRNEVRMTRLREAILTSLKIGSLVTFAVMAPNVAGLLGKTYSHLERRKTMGALTRLKQKGLVVEKNGHLEITPRGRRMLDLSHFDQRASRRWDRKWRIVIFDIPEHRKAYRNALRDHLRRIGFTKLQHSAWIYPHDCEELITLLKTEYRLGKEVTYIIADKIDNPQKFKKEFGIR